MIVRPPQPCETEGVSLSLSPRLQSSGAIIADCSLELLGSNDPPTLASCILRAGTTGTSQCIQLSSLLAEFSRAECRSGQENPSYTKEILRVEETEYTARRQP
ncbi:serine/threonine-protein kinase Nek4-like isoform X4 [Symphalangus syndactylus]|uniref:serine/threonine-protein kinase Nek4-like isoform X4 n=1 Tax=Symphalangus syndactylus TaxID=9590 RepID=UPI0030077D4F